MFAILGDRLFNNIVPVATLVFVVVAAIATFVLNFTRFGRYVFAVGGDERARFLEDMGKPGQLRPAPDEWPPFGERGGSRRSARRR